MTTHEPEPAGVIPDAAVSAAIYAAEQAYDLLGTDEETVFQKEVFRAAVRAAQPFMVGAAELAIKPLEWIGEDHSREGSRAASIFGTYILWTVEDGGVWLQLASEFKGKEIGQVARAKAAAQADFDARIRPALVSAPEAGKAEGAWHGPGETPHDYHPDAQAMGDCSICGHTRAAHVSPAEERERGDMIDLPPHIKFRRDALALAATMDAADFVGEFDPPTDDTVETLARTLAIVAGGYDWTVDHKGRLAALVAGDQGYTSTNLVLDLAALASNDARETAEADLAIGDRIEISTLYEFCGDWRGWTGFVAGIGVNQDGDLRYTTSEQWPPEHGTTDGWKWGDLQRVASRRHPAPDGGAR